MNFKQNILPHVAAVAIFFVATVAFYNPLVFGGKIINQHDIVQGLGASQEIIKFRAETGEEALWTNSMFGGMPAYLLNTQWSGDLILYVHRMLTLWLPAPAGVTLISCITFYILLLVFKVRPWLAVIGGLAFSIGTYNIISIEAGHMWKMWAIAYMPLVLAGVHLTFDRNYLLGMVLTALGLALELRSNHLQITYYLLLLLLIYGIVHLVFSIREGKFYFLTKSLSYLAVAVVLAVGCNLGKIWSVYEYGQYSTRGPSDLVNTQGPSNGLDRGYAFHWSNGIIEPITLLIPEFFGGPSVSSLPVDSNLGEALRSHGMAPVQIRQQLLQVTTYWGNQPSTAGPSYAGAIVIFLFVLGYSLTEKKHLIWISIAIVISTMLSWGHNFESFNNLIFDYFPGYNKFRSVSMTLVIALLCIPLAAFMGLEKLLQDLKKPESLKKLLVAGAITGGILLLAIVYSSIGDFHGSVDDGISNQVPPWYLDALRADRADLLRSDAFRSLIFVGLAMAALYFKIRAKIGLALLYGILGVLVLLDIWSVDKRYLRSEDFVMETQGSKIVPSAADKVLLKDPDLNYRVLSYLQNPWTETRTSYFHKSLGGYHGAKMKRYQELIDGCLDSQYRGLLEGLQSGRQDLGEFGIVNMMNTRYILVGTDESGVLRNDSALGNAWLVNSVKKVNSADQELEQTCAIDPSSTAVVDESRFTLSANTYNNSGEITLEEYRPNYLKYRFQNPENTLAVFSEIYYPKGWNATIDGEPADIIRVNYILRALEISGGSHTIEFRFEPQSYQIGNKVMMASSILLILLFAGTIFLEIKKRKPRPVESDT